MFLNCSSVNNNSVLIYYCSLFSVNSISRRIAIALHPLQQHYIIQGCVCVKSLIVAVADGGGAAAGGKVGEVGSALLTKTALEHDKPYYSKVEKY